MIPVCMCYLCTIKVKSEEEKFWEECTFYILFIKKKSSSKMRVKEEEATKKCVYIICI